MKLTVADIYHSPELSTMTLIAGKEGLSREVGACGILDYEFDPMVSDKYSEFNYRQKNFMTLTSFLYARENEFLIMDAVKKLIARGGSGLIIKNVFNLTIHENVIKYANYMNFPIFIMRDKSIFFEDIILLIAKKAEHCRSLNYCSTKADDILSLREDPSKVEHIAREINISFKDDLLAVYLLGTKPLTEEKYMNIEEAFTAPQFLSASDSIFLYKNGIVLLFTADMLSKESIKQIPSACARKLGKEKKNFHIGVSRCHHVIGELGYALNEAIEAAKLCDAAGSELLLYEDLGVYKILMPYAKDAVMQNYSREYVEKLHNFDAEHSGSLLKTATVYVRMDGDVNKTAAMLNQHPNTIRNRLNKINDILHINIFSHFGYEQLSIAVKINLCAKE